MKCKFCGAQLEQKSNVCPACGEKNAPEKKETVNIWMVIGATVVCVLLLIVLAGAVIYGVTGELPYNLGAKETTAATAGADPTTATETLAGPEDLGMIIEGITDIAHYTVEDAQAVSAADTVVAKIGDYELTNGLLQAFYFMEFSNFVVDAQEAGYDLAGSYELDITKPLGDQLVVGSTVTWEQFFVHNALGAWWRYVSVNLMADEVGFTISAEDRAALDAVPAQLEADALEEGFENAEALIKDRLGPACDMDDYLAYMELTARGDLYYTEYQKTYIPTDEDVQAFFTQNADYYAYYYGVTEETGKLAAVRHVLLVPEGATTDESTGYVVASDEQWAAGELAAQAMLDTWVASGAAEESFAEMANDYSTDGGSNTNGGLYEGVLAGQMVENFDAWVFDESRKPGDYGIVRTEFGYHLMYFVSLSENEAWYEYAYEDAISYAYGFNQALSAAMDTNTPVPALESIALTDVVYEAAQTEEATDPTETTAAE